jgi:DNA-directed RNA polymerase specialized sigma24 family protein
MWLWTVARNCMLTYFRRNKNDLETEYDDSVLEDSNHSSVGTGLASLEDCVQIAFEKFSESHKERAEVLRLATIEGWSMNELATFLSRTVGATREYVSQCRKYFRPFLELCRDYI